MTTIYNDGNGNITVDGVTYTTAQYLAMGGAAGLGIGGTPSTQSQSALDGRQMLQDFLNDYGLSGLDLDTAWQAYVSSGSNTDYWMNTWLPTTSAFKTAYPAYDYLMKQGRGITVEQYREYQQNLYATAHQAGFPQGVVDNDTVTKFLEAGVPASEAQQRVIDASTAVNNLDKNSQAYFQAREAGISDGDMASYWFDPSKSLPVLENKLKAAQIGGAAANAGIGLDTSIAGQLAKTGVTQAQAQQGFNQLANDQQLFHALPGQAGTGMGQASQVGAEFQTDAAAQQALAAARAGRLAPFEQGGRYSTSQQGIVGAGAARGA
jgi:hypothetical protein